MWPSSWKARIRWSGIPFPSVTSGAVTSIPSFTRSGRPSASLRSRPPSGRTCAALRISSERAMGPASLALDSCGSGAAFRPKAVACEAAAQDPQAAAAQPPPAPVPARRRVVQLRARSPRSRARSPRSTRPACSKQEVDGYIYARPRNRVLAVLRGSESRIIDPPDKISPRMKHAIIAVEDKRFYEHRGVDVHAIVRALLGRRPQQEGRRGRLDDHAAVHQEHLPAQRALDRPEAQGGRARLAARAALVEGPDPDRLPEHDLLRQRRVRGRAGGAHLLRHRPRRR